MQLPNSVTIFMKESRFPNKDFIFLSYKEFMHCLEENAWNDPLRLNCPYNWFGLEI